MKTPVIVAVSGGIDSMVLLDMIVKNSTGGFVVAHVDHGMRNDSEADARFVEAQARKYNLEFVSCRLELGILASEETARNARYNFLIDEAKKRQATVVTAHHRDDMIGSIVINISRGTGWRGLAVMNHQAVKRPLLRLTKRELYDYAVEHRLEWVEDETNQSAKYLRNRQRAGVLALSEPCQLELEKLRLTQVELQYKIDAELQLFNYEQLQSRYFYQMIDIQVAVELIKYHLQHRHGVSIVDRQASQALLAIKTARARKIHQISQGIQMKLTPRDVIIDRVDLVTERTMRDYGDEKASE